MTVGIDLKSLENLRIVNGYGDIKKERKVSDIHLWNFDNYLPYNFLVNSDYFLLVDSVSFRKFVYKKYLQKTCELLDEIRQP